MREEGLFCVAWSCYTYISRFIIRVVVLHSATDGNLCWYFTNPTR